MNKLHKVGEMYRFKGGGLFYILAQITPAQVALISILSGHRWSDGVVVGDSDRITEWEWAFIVGPEYLEDFILVPSLKMVEPKMTNAPDLPDLEWDLDCES